MCRLYHADCIILESLVPTYTQDFVIQCLFMRFWIQSVHPLYNATGMVPPLHQSVVLKMTNARLTPRDFIFPKDSFSHCKHNILRAKTTLLKIKKHTIGTREKIGWQKHVLPQLRPPCQNCTMCNRCKTPASITFSSPVGFSSCYKIDTSVVDSQRFYNS